MRVRNMGMICLECGNEKKFIRSREYAAYHQITLLINGQGDELKEISDDIVDGEYRDVGTEPITCHKCECTNVLEYDTEKQLVEAKMLHTDKKGKWHSDGLPEDQQNKRFVRKFMALTI